MKKRQLLILLLILTLVATSCGQAYSLNVKHLTIKKAVEFFSSERMDGRLAGTDGNLRAQNAIAEAFEKLGLEKYAEDSWLMDYKQDFYNPDEQQYTMKLGFEGQETRTCVYGSEYMPRVMLKSIHIAAPITWDISDTGIRECVYVTDKLGDVKLVRSKACAVLVRVDSFMNIPNVRESGMQVIQINKELYELLKSKGKANVQLDWDMKSRKITASNVVGKIKGKDSKSAVVISAHFDHAGRAGGNVFYGAVDNASGVSAMLVTAKKLKEHWKDTMPAQDIVFCAFNGEDSGGAGSMTVIQRLKKDYKNMYDINIDYLGEKSQNTLVVAGDKDVGEKLMADMISYMASKGFSCKEGGLEYSSDHLGFSENGISSLNLGQEKTPLLHTVQDTADKIDFGYLDKVSKALYDFVIKNEGKNYPVRAEDTTGLQGSGAERSTVSVQQRLKKEADKLNLGEYKVIMIDGRRYIASKFDESFRDYGKFKEAYPDLNIPAEIGGYKASEISVIYYRDNPSEDMEAGKVYSIPVYRDQINAVQCIYTRDAGSQLEALAIAIRIFDNVNNPELLQNYNKMFMESCDLDIHDSLIGDRPYKFFYEKNVKAMYGVVNVRNVGQKTYMSQVMRARQEQGSQSGQDDPSYKPYWSGASKEEVLEFLNGIKINTYLDQMINSL